MQSFFGQVNSYETIKSHFMRNNRPVKSFLILETSYLTLDTHWTFFGSFQERDCEARCLSIPACTHFVWQQLESGICFFKSGSVIRMDAVPDQSSRPSICGVVPLNRTRDSSTFCSFKGQDLGQAMVSQEQCPDACQNDEKCTHYEWTESKGGTCSLKLNRTASMSDVTRTRRFSICGLIREKIPASSFRRFVWNEETNSASRCDFIGSGLKAEPTSSQDCPNKCSQFPKCTHFAW